MNATIVKDFLNDDKCDEGVVLQTGPENMAGRAQRRRFRAYDDDRILYYEIVADLADDDTDLGDLLIQLGSFAGVTELEDITGDGDDWSAS